MIPDLRTGPWCLSDLPKKRVGSVFSIFHCGGGSTMGYKLAGLNVLGGVEIDPQMMTVYRANHSPAHSFEMGVQEFNAIDDRELPAELFDLDILDGSPPCSVFSMAGDREKKWGEEHAFREGQSSQVLDDLFGHFVATAKKLRPKVIVAENVKGMLAGAAKGYVAEVFRHLRDAGYQVQLFLVNASRMGVPQRRERVFFIARQESLGWVDLQLEFCEAEVSLETAFAGLAEQSGLALSTATTALWRRCRRGKSLSTVHPKGQRFNEWKASPSRPCCTLTARFAPMHWAEPRRFSAAEVLRTATFPDDFRLEGAQAYYLAGMSVPPFMMQRIATEIRKQWLG